MSKPKRESSTALLHPSLQVKIATVLEQARKEKLNVDVFETLRSEELQKHYLSIGSSRTMQSYHRLGLACDIVFKDSNGRWTWEGNWDRLGEIMEANGLYSYWKRHGWDGAHCELRVQGFTTKQLYKVFEEAGGDVREFWNRTIDKGVNSQEIQWTKEELAKIAEFKEFLLHKRKGVSK